MATSGGIRWVRIVLGALLIEVALFAVILPMYALPNGAMVVLYLVLPVTLAAAFGGAFWVASKVDRAFVLHGLLVGALAALIYAAITWKTTLPATYVVANYLKILAGAAGGFVAQRMTSRASPATPTS